MAGDTRCTRCARTLAEHAKLRRAGGRKGFYSLRVCDDGKLYGRPSSRKATYRAGQSFGPGEAELFAAIMARLPSVPEMAVFVRHPRFSSLARKAKATKNRTELLETTRPRKDVAA
jgi:hypothetical protein